MIQNNIEANHKMVLETRSVDIKQRMVSKKRLFSTTLLGVGLIVISIIFTHFDPFLYITENKLRLENGSMLHELLLRRFQGPKIYLYLFNVTNADEFLSGSDEKLKLEEIGPFVYQEYRINEDLEINKDPGIMRYTPRLQTVFILEESIGRPEDFYLTVPNIPLLSAAALMSQYPYFVRQIFNILAASSHSKAFRKMRAYEQLWGYSDPLINMANTAIPGLIYFKSVGLMERLYDFDVNYRLEIRTKSMKKFSVKKVTKFTSKDKNHSEVLSEYTYKDSYEGAAFPPHMTPEMPIHIFRHGLCKTLQLQHAGSRLMNYGGNAFVYHVHNTTFIDHQLCDTNGWCPGGLKNVAPCYFGLPIALSKTHFLDSNPRLLDRVEGLKPDRKIHDTEIIIDPKLGVAITGSMSLQLNLFLADMAYNMETRRLKDTVLPISHLTVKAPPLLPEVRSALQLMYSQGPCILLSVQILCTLLGLGLLAYSARMMYLNWVARKSSTGVEKVKKSHRPLLLK